jgi:hypothetical protein
MGTMPITPLAREIGRDIGIGILLIDHGIRRIVEWEEDYAKAKTLFGRRKEDSKMSLLTVINGITLAEKDAIALSGFLANLPTYLPVIEKQLADIQKAASDKSNPVALAGDVSTLLGDLSTDMSTIVPMIQNLLPNLPKPTATPPAAQ